MKKILIIIALAFGLTTYAQNKTNVSKETKTTTTTVNHGDEEKKVVKTEQVTTQQSLELKDAQSKKLNKDLKPTPTKVTKTTTISGDGIATQTGHTTYYELNGRRFTFVSDKTGYRISSPDVREYAVVTRTASDGKTYTYTTKSGTSKAYFDADGNFVVETYDAKSKKTIKETYIKVKQ